MTNFLFIWLLGWKQKKNLWIVLNLEFTGIVASITLIFISICVILIMGLIEVIIFIPNLEAKGKKIVFITYQKDSRGFRLL